MAMHGFCRTNGKLVNVGSKRLPDCACFSGIIRLWSGPVRVHVIDLFSRKMPVLERGVHGASRAFSEWTGKMIRVSRHAEAGKFCVNFCPARTCVLQCFENQHGGTFTKDETSPILRKGTTGVRRHDPHRFPSFYVS